MVHNSLTVLSVTFRKGYGTNGFHTTSFLISSRKCAQAERTRHEELQQPAEQHGQQRGRRRGAGRGARAQARDARPGREVQEGHGGERQPRQRKVPAYISG